MENGLPDAADEQLVQQVYAISAAKREHPRVANGDGSRRVPLIVDGAIGYLVNRYAASRTLAVPPTFPT